MPAKNNIIQQLSKLFVVRDKTGTFGSSTLSAATAIGATTLPTTSLTNFSDGDLIRVGSGEEMELALITGTPSGGNITVTQGLVYAHASGEAVVEQVAYDIGDIEAAGVNVNFAGESQDINVATKRLAFTTLNGYVDASMEFALPTFTLDNFALATGILPTKILGSGTALSPKSITTNGSEFAGASNVSLVAVGTKFDGSYIRVELWGVDFDYTGVNFALSRGQLVSTPVKGIAAAGGAFFSTNYAFAVDSSIKPTKGKVFDALTEAGYFLDTATTTTVASADVAAGAVLINFTSAASFAADEWFRVGSGDTAQFFQVASKVSNAVTVKNAAYALIALGATITKVTPTKFAGVGPDGVSVSLGGSVESLRIAERRLSIGTRAGAATVSATIPTVDVSLANIAFALGIPAAQISGNRLPVGDKIGTSTLDGVYVKGLLQDGTIAWAVFAGNAMDVSAFAVAINNAGPAATIPITVKPSSYLQLFQHP